MRGLPYFLECLYLFNGQRSSNATPCRDNGLSSCCLDRCLRHTHINTYEAYAAALRLMLYGQQEISSKALFSRFGSYEFQKYNKHHRKPRKNEEPGLETTKDPAFLLLLLLLQFPLRMLRLICQDLWYRHSNLLQQRPSQGQVLPQR